MSPHWAHRSEAACGTSYDTMNSGSDHLEAIESQRQGLALFATRQRGRPPKHVDARK